MQRQDIENFIHSNFAPIIQDYPWENTPDFTVFRHADTRKWFAIIMTIPRSGLKLSENPPATHELLEIINLKCDPDLIDDLLQQPGFYPAYHMNKRHWITLILQQTAPDTLQNLIDLSFRLTQK